MSRPEHPARHGRCPRSDDEVVTEAKLRKVDLPGGAGVAGADHPRQRSRPHQAEHLRPEGLISLNTAIDAALADDEIVAIGVTGKPFIFAAGADLSAVTSGGRERRRARRRARPRGVPQAGRGRQAVLRASSTALALGGGLEVALHCTYRTVIGLARRPCACPRCFLGLVPGWGGAFLLPNLIGADKRRHGDPREPAEPEPHAQAARRPSSSASPTRCFERRRLPGAVAALGGRGAHRRGLRRARRDRPRRRLGRGGRPRRDGSSLSKTGGAAPAAVPRAGSHRRRPGRRPATRASPPRTRRSAD